MNTNGAGVAICSCGCELEIRCTGGCAEPDIVFEPNPVALMHKQLHHRPAKVHRPWKGPGFCNFLDCEDPVVPKGEFGCPPKKCQKHLDMIRRYRNAYDAKKAARASA